MIIRTLRVVWVFACIGSISARAEDSPLSFDKDIRLILSENCYACHGFDADAREAGLRLDVRQDALDAGDIIVPGDSSASGLVERILSSDPDDVMPPPDSGRTLTALQKKS